jgi:hypothetical protein
MDKTEIIQTQSPHVNIFFTPNNEYSNLIQYKSKLEAESPIATNPLPQRPEDRPLDLIYNHTYRPSSSQKL